MIKLKDILSEAYAWERQEGKPLPTLAEVQAAYQAKLREDAHNEDPEEDDHEYTADSDLPEPYDPDADDDDYMHEAEDKADKDYDGDGEVESGSEEYLGSRDKAIKAASNTKANTTAYGNYVNKARAKSHLTNKDVCVYGIKGTTGTEITNASDLDNYNKFTIKSKDDSIDEYGGQDSDGIHADGPKNANSDVREKEQMIESFNKRMLGNLHGHEYILREAFKRK
jgi:hypothetical protein